ncbi:hypothetical protein J0H58_18990 [bacterium]|nr:hypothetical protein [bacterium]
MPDPTALPEDVVPDDDPPPPEHPALAQGHPDDGWVPRRRRKKRGLPIGGLIAVGFLGLFALILVVGAVLRSDRAAVHNAKVKNPQPPAAKERVDPFEAAEDGNRRRPVEGDSGRTFLGMSLLGAILLGVFLYGLASVLLAIWVIQDTRNRSVENGVLWMLMIFPFNFLALLIYLASRPAGSLIACEWCGNSRLAYVGVCPHCRREVEARGRVC